MKDNPYLAIELGLYRAQISFTHVCLTHDLVEFRRQEFRRALGKNLRKDDRIVPGTPQIWDAVFFCPAPYGCCLDHTAALLVEDEDKCREKWGFPFEETRYLPYPEDGIGPIFITDRPPEPIFTNSWLFGQRCSELGAPPPTALPGPGSATA